MPRLVGYPVELTKRPPKKWTEAVTQARMKLRIGQEYRTAKREGPWKQSEDQYEGRHWDGRMAGDDVTQDLITVNMSFSTVNTIVPYITASEPNFLVQPYSGQATVRNAAIQAALLNRQWRSRKISGNRHLRDGTVDALIYGDGWLKLGYTIAERRVSEEDYADVAELWVQRTSPWDVWLDPTSDGIHNARWVAQRLLVPKRQLQEDKTYKNTHDENVSYQAKEQSATAARDNEIRFGQEVFDGSEYAVLYEFTDLVNKTVITFSEGDLPLRVVEDVGESMFVQIQNYRIPNSPYHMGELEQLWDLQREINKTRTHMISHRKRNVQKFFARDGVLDTAALAALKSNIVNDVAFVKGNEPLENIVRPAEVPGLTADVYNVSDVIKADIYEISGINEYQRGASPEIRRTATESTIIEGASNIKTQFKLRMVESAAREAGNLFLATARDVYPQTDYDEMQLFLTGRDAEAIQKVTQGDELAQMMDAGAPPEEIAAAQAAQPPVGTMDVMISPTPDIFTGEYEVEVEQSSTELRNPQMREEKYRGMVEMYVAMAPAIMPLGVNLNIKRFIELHLEAAKIDDIDALFLPPAPPPAPPGMEGMMGEQPTGQPPGPDEGAMPSQPPAPPEAPPDEGNSGIMEQIS